MQVELSNKVRRVCGVWRSECEGRPKPHQRIILEQHDTWRVGGARRGATANDQCGPSLELHALIDDQVHARLATALRAK